MKKVYRLFAAALCFAAGVTTVSARHWNYNFASPVAPTEIQAGVPYALHAGFSAAAGDSHFLSGEAFSHTSQLYDANLYTFEEAGEVNGKKAYYLKGKLGYIAMPGNVQFYTAQKERAWKLVVNAAVAGEANHSYERVWQKDDGTDTTHTYTGLDAYYWEAKQQEQDGSDIETDFSALSFSSAANEENALVFASAESNKPKEKVSYYNFLLTYASDQSGHGKPGKAADYNRNVWKIYTVEQSSAKENLEGVLNNLVGEGVELEEKLKDYKRGNGVGEYSAEKYDALLKLWQEAKAIVNKDEDPADEARADQLAEAFPVAYDEFVKSGKGLTEGYYILTSWRVANPGSATYDSGAIYDGAAVSPGDNVLLWSWNGQKRFRRNNTVTYTNPETLTWQDAKFIWKVEANPAKPGYFFFKNVETDQYIGSVDKQNTAIPMTKEPTASYNIVANPDVPNYFSFYSPDLWKKAGVEFSGIHCAGDWEGVVAWDWRTGGSSWKVRTLTEEEVQRILAGLEQPKRNAALKELVEKVEASVARGRAYMGVNEDGTKNEKATSGDVSEVDGLVTSADQLFCAMGDKVEGTDLNRLLDNNLGTYYHSTWRGGAEGWDANHFLQFNLNAPQQELFVKWVKRTGTNDNNKQQGSPKQVVIWATNNDDLKEVAATESENEAGETVKNLDAWKAQWDSVGVAQFDYPYTVMNGETKLNNHAGTCYFKADKQYKYYRLAMVQKLAAGSRWFHASEVRVYKGAYDKAGSLLEAVPENVLKALTDQITSAKAELTAEKATEAQVTALKAAYEEFLKNYPDPTRVKNAIAEAKEFQEKAREEAGKLGYYAAGSKDAYKTVIDEVEGKLNQIVATRPPSVAEIEELLAKLDAGSAEFAAKLQVPESGYYMIKSNTATTHMFDRGLYVANSSTEQSVKLAGRVKPEGETNWKDDDTFKNRLGAYWKVEKVEGGYTYQNLYTGLYLAPASAGKPEADRNRVVTQSETPYVFAIRFAREPGCFNMVAKAEDTQKGHVFMNADPGSSNLVFWSSASGRDNSAFRFEKANMSDLEEVVTNGFVHTLEHLTKPQIVTFPIALVTGEEDSNFYTVIGQDATNAIQLKKVKGDLNAGQAYIFIPGDENAEKNVTLFPKAENLADLVTTHKVLEPVNGLVATFEKVKLPANSGKFNSDRTLVLLSEQNEEVAPNTGYFTLMPETTEKGDAQILANGKITTVGGVVLSGKVVRNAVYTISGVRVKDAKKLPAGLYIVNGQKQLVK